MRTLIAAVALVAASGAAMAADVGVSIGFSQPGLSGQISFGDYYPSYRSYYPAYPVYVNPRPVVVAPPVWRAPYPIYYNGPYYDRGWRGHGHGRGHWRGHDHDHDHGGRDHGRHGR